jgi:LmbE family N-acetylglucosaminyl deacetylase
MTDSAAPASAMVIVAHPDDAEFTVAGTVALWAREGCRVTYVLCTDGNTGSHEPGMTRERLAEIRRNEQRAACATLGVTDVEFLGYDDGQLQPTLELRRDLVRVIRDRRPEVVLAFDPTMLFGGDGYINHPDHRAAAQAALDAVAPACEMPLLWPEVGPPHRVQQVYVHGSDHATLWVDISPTIDTKIEALKKHTSQMGDWDPTEMIKNWNSETAEAKGLAYAEAFRVITFHRRASGDADVSEAGHSSE